MRARLPPRPPCCCHVYSALLLVPPTHPALLGHVWCGTVEQQPKEAAGRGEGGLCWWGPITSRVRVHDTRAATDTGSRLGAAPSYQLGLLTQWDETLVVAGICWCLQQPSEACTVLGQHERLGAHTHTPPHVRSLPSRVAQAPCTLQCLHRGCSICGWREGKLSVACTAGASMFGDLHPPCAAAAKPPPRLF